MNTLSYGKCFLELIGSYQFIESGIPGMDRILGEISSGFHLIRDLHTALFKRFKQSTDDVGMRALLVFCHEQCFERFLYCCWQSKQRSSYRTVS